MFRNKTFILLILIVLLSVTGQVGHIINVNQKPQYFIQLSRIDFNEDIDSAEAIKIRGFIQSLNGVNSSYFNIQDNILVYTYDNKLQSSQSIYNALIKYKAYRAKPYIVDAEDLKSGCPVHFDNSILKSLKSLFLN